MAKRRREEPVASPWWERFLEHAVGPGTDTALEVEEPLFDRADVPEDEPAPRRALVLDPSANGAPLVVYPWRLEHRSSTLDPQRAIDLLRFGRDDGA